MLALWAIRRGAIVKSIPHRVIDAGFFRIMCVMPTLSENLTYLYRRKVEPNRASIVHLLKSLLVLLLVAVALETFVFNFNYFASAGNKPIDLKDRIELPKGDDGFFRVTSVNRVLEFSNLNAEVRNIRIDFDSSQPAQNLVVKINFTDDAHRAYFDSTEYTVGVPEVEISTMSTQSEFINLNTAGYVGSLRIEITGRRGVVPDQAQDRHRERASSLRVLVASFLACVRRASLGVHVQAPLFGVSHQHGRQPRQVEGGHHRRGSRRDSARVHVFVLRVQSRRRRHLHLQLRLLGRQVGRERLRSGRENAQQYAELARAMAHGQLYLDEEPPDWLKSMDDPYDKSARDELQKETGEPYLFDVAYYDGHYYVYFGVVPVLLFYLPFYLATGANFPTAIGVLVMAIAFILGCSALLDRFARYHFKRVSLGVYLLLQIPLVMCCGMLYLVKFPAFYSLPIMCGLAFSVWGLYCWMRGRLSKHACAWFMLGSFCMALVADAGRSSSCSRSWRFRCSGEPHHRASRPHACGRARACVSARAVRGGRGGNHGLQLRALRFAVPISARTTI